MRSGILPNGTLCMVRSQDCPHYNGMVVMVVKRRARHGDYICEPDLMGKDGSLIAWYRCALIPLHGDDGVDEMIRRVGKPEDAHA